MKKVFSTTGKRLILACFFLTLISSAWSQDKLIDILRAELQREKKIFDTCSLKPYYISLRVEDTKVQGIQTNFGALIASREVHQRVLTPTVRVGSYKLDNYHPESQRFMGSSGLEQMPVDDNDIAIRQSIWSALDRSYRFAINVFGSVKASKSVNVAAEDKSMDFTKAEVVKYFEPPMTGSQIRLDRQKWEARLRKYSALFLKDPHIISGTATLSFENSRKYYIDTDGSETAENRISVRVLISGSVKADDGMELPLYLSYFSFNPDGLPDDKVIENDVLKLVDKLSKIRTAPVVQPYTGPALLLGTASGVFFHEIFGHRVEGQRMRNESDGQTFKKKVGESVLPSTFSVTMDPTAKKFRGQDLSGYYNIDDQGVRSEKVNVVVNGILKDFLMTRTPLDGFTRSNGHARASMGMDVTSRQSNLIVTTSDLKTDAQLRSLLIEEAKKQGKEYGYIFASVLGGYTLTMTNQPNAFNISPIEVYRVFVDGRPDEMVRGVDLVGTPLSMFSQIICAGGNSEIYTGYCGAESGNIPVTAVSPSILVKQVEMQRKGKSTDRPPILDRPTVSLTENN
ncbi:MAG: metallopeptidase TldD-related protein [Bacteroidota bacterium]|nr:metallopeptidase TldD-related protein [Bacteroidota bacterium]